MKKHKILSRLISIVTVLLMMIPAIGTVFAENEDNLTLGINRRTTLSGELNISTGGFNITFRAQNSTKPGSADHMAANSLTDMDIDAYIVPLEYIDIINQYGNMLELTNILMQAAPEIYEIASVAQGNEVYGIPLAPTLQPQTMRNAILVRNDIVRQHQIQIDNFGDVLSYLEFADQNLNGIKTLIFYDNEKSYDFLLNSWLSMEGYTNLQSMLISDQARDYMLVSPSDASASVIPIERLPSFTSAMSYFKFIYQNENVQIMNIDESLTDRTPSRTVYSNILRTPESYGAIILPMTLENLRRCNEIFVYTLDEYTIFPITGNDLQQTISPLKQNVVVIPKYAENRADDIIAFIKWLYDSQENYDSFLYGVEGLNYETLEGGIIQPLKDGQPVEKDILVISAMGGIQTPAIWYGVWADVFECAEYARPMVFDPVGTGDAFNDMANSSSALLVEDAVTRAAQGYADKLGQLDSMLEASDAVTGRRQAMQQLMELVLSKNSQVTDSMITEMVAGLGAAGDETARLYQVFVDELMSR